MENETPTLAEAVEQASSSLQSSESETAQTGSKEEVTTSESDVQETPTKEAQEQSNDYGVDLSKLPDELKPIYEDMKRNMDKGFTQGRQKDREELNDLRKELAQLKRNSQPQEDLRNLTPEQQIERLAEQKVLDAKLNDFRDQALKDYNDLDKRLNNSEDNGEYDQVMDVAISTQLDRMLEDHIAIHGNELGFDYKSHAKELIKAWDDKFSNYFETRIAKQREMAKKQESKTQKANPRTSSAQVKPSDTMSIEDAVNAAYGKLGS